MHKKNLIKLLPAVAVIIAVASAGLQTESELKNEKTVQAAENKIVESKELKSLLTSAYFSEPENADEEESLLKTGSKKKSKKKKAGITTGKAKALPEKSAEASGQGQGSTTTPTTSVPKDGYKDGTYQGSGTGFGGTVTVQVTVADGKITAIDIVDASGETPSYFASAKGVISKMLAGQTPNVDAVSGATYSSNGIIQAVQNALSKAGGKETQPVKKTKKKKTIPTPTVTPTVKPRPTQAASGDENAEVKYKDGTYTGKARGYSGFVTISLTIKDGVITEVSNTNTDTKSFFRKAWKVLQPAILEHQSADGIDAVSGATFSSNGIIGAAQNAIEAAKITVKPTATPTPAPEATVTPTAAPEATPTPSPVPTAPPTATPTPAPEENPTATPTPTAAPTETPDGKYIDGTYTGSGEGNYGPGSVTVTVTIAGSQITSASYTTEDDEEYFTDAWNGIYGQIMGKQTAEGIDAVNGSTYSSHGIIQAFQNAISQAKRQ